MITVPHYGIHEIEGVKYLFQGTGATNFAGLKQARPMSVTNPHGVKFCNHRLPTAAPVPDKLHWNAFLQILADPLTQVMLPIPRPNGDRCYFHADPDDTLYLDLPLLSRLSSPISRL